MASQGGKRVGAGRPKNQGNAKAKEFSDLLYLQCRKAGLNVWGAFIEIANDTLTPKELKANDQELDAVVYRYETVHRMKALTELASYLERKKVAVQLQGDEDRPIAYQAVQASYTEWLETQEQPPNGHHDPSATTV